MQPASRVPENNDALSRKRMRTNPETLANRGFSNLSLLYRKGIAMLLLQSKVETISRRFKEIWAMLQLPLPLMSMDM